MPKVADLLDQYDKLIAAAFLASVQELRTRADFNRLVNSIAARNLDDSISAVHIQNEAFDPLAESIRDGFNSSGTQTIEVMPLLRDSSGQYSVFRWSTRNARAEQWLAQESGTLIQGITSDQLVSVRTALLNGFQRGQDPEQTALDIVGRVSKGGRVGGILGLTAAQEQYVRNARDELSSGDPSLMRNYLDRNLRDRRFDAIVTRAIGEDRPVSDADIARIEQRYRDRLLQMRGEAIGRTESLAAVRAGEYEAYSQVVDSGAYPEGSLVRIWRSMGDEKVRDTHAEMDGQAVSMDEPFTSPSGAELMFPGDTSLGAPAEEIINCRCEVEYEEAGPIATTEEPTEGELVGAEQPVETPDQLIELPVESDQFDAVDYTDAYTDPGVTPEDVIADVQDRRPDVEDLAGRLQEFQDRIAAGTQTMDLFTDENGNWTPEREQLHLDILYLGQWIEQPDPLTGEMTRIYVPPIFSMDEIIKATPTDGEAPTFIMLGGRGGSGKSKLAGIAYDPNNAIVLDNDAIKARLPEFAGWNAALLHEEASVLFDEATAIARQYGLNVVQDATMKTTAKAIAMVRSFIDAGYETEAAYMYLPMQEAAARSIERFLTGEGNFSGRFVPASTVLSNTTNEASFNAIKDIVDRWSFWDNQFSAVDQPPVLVSSSNWTALNMTSAVPELPIAALRYTPMEPGLDMPEQREYNPNSKSDVLTRQELENAHQRFALVNIPEPMIEDVDAARYAIDLSSGALERVTDPKAIPGALVDGIVKGKQAIDKLPGIEALDRYMRSTPVILQDMSETSAGGYTVYQGDRTSIVMMDTAAKMTTGYASWATVVERARTSDPSDRYALMYLHEMGHVIDNISGHRLSQAFGSIVTTEMGAEGADEERSIRDWTRTNISDYAAKNVQEGFAEAFALYMGDRMGIKFSMQKTPFSDRVTGSLLPFDMGNLIRAKSS